MVRATRRVPLLGAIRHLGPALRPLFEVFLGFGDSLTGMPGVHLLDDKFPVSLDKEVECCADAFTI